MAMIKPECNGCSHFLELTSGCSRLGHGLRCVVDEMHGWKGDVDEPNYGGIVSPREEFAYLYGPESVTWVHPDPSVTEQKLQDATANAMLQSAFEKQVGGSHYKDMAIQPVEYILANKLGFVEGAVIKYVSRWPAKGGVQDLKKARHLLDLLIETLEEPKPSL